MSSRLRWPRRVLVAVLAAASLTGVVCAPAPAAPLTPWPDTNQGTFGYTWLPDALGLTGVTATHSINPRPPVGNTDHVWAPTLYPGGTACFEMATVHDSDGNIYVRPWDWCGQGGWQTGRLVDADFRARYVRDDRYTIRIVRSNAVTNTWTAYLFNRSTNAWEFLYSKGGVHNGDPSGGWDYFETYSYYNEDTGLGGFCDRTAGFRFALTGLSFRVNNVWVPANPAQLSTVGSSNGSDYGCPGLTLTRGTDASWTVTNAPLSCTVRPVLTGANGSFTLAIKIDNPNAYPVFGWKLKVSLTGAQTVTTGAGVTFGQAGSEVTATSGAGNGTIAADGGFVTFALLGTSTGANSLPSSYRLDTGFTTSTCTVV